MKFSFAYQSTSTDRFNDQYDPQTPINLERTVHQFRLSPQSSHWRFGVIFTDTPELPDKTAPSYDRYDFTKYQYLQVNVGTITESGVLEHPTFIQVTDMQQPPFYEENDYIPFSEVEFLLEPVTMNKWQYTCNYMVNGEMKSTSREIELRFMKFVFFAAWCDFNPYALNCEIGIDQLLVHPRIVGQLGSTFEGELHFRLGDNIVVRLGNLLDDYSLANMNAIVLPASVSGKTSASSDKLLSARRIQQALPNVHGALVRAKTSPVVRNRIYWAYTVSDQNITDQRTIELICLQLLANEPDLGQESGQDYYQVAIPLLGTGSGKLDILAVAKLFHHQFNNRQDKVKIVLTTVSSGKFNYLKAHVGEIESPGSMYTHSEDYLVKNELEPALNVEHVAKCLTVLLDRFPQDKGVIVGIFGRWGRGKTYLMNQVWKEVEKGTAKTIAPVRVNFHAWKYQDTPAVWAYLYEQFSEAYLAPKKRKWWANFLLNIKRNGKSRPIWFLIGLLFSVTLAFISFQYKRDFLTNLFSLISVGTVVSLCITYFRYVGKAKSIYQDYLLKPSFSKVLGLQAEIQREMSLLMDVWSKELAGKRLVLFVDDIDRCPESMIIKIVDALRVMVEDESIARHVIVFVSMDDRILRRAIRHKFHALYGGTPDQPASRKEGVMVVADSIDDLVNEYIDKLFISGIRLGDLTPREMDEVLDAVMDRQPAEVQAPQPEKPFATLVQSVPLPTVGIEAATVSTTQQTQAELETSVPELPASPPVSESMVLADFEAARLRKFIGEVKTLTPRQIKITYYRYLLARTILIGLCKNANLTFIWLEADNNEILIALLIFYSQNNNRISLEQERLRVASNKERLSTLTARNNMEMPTDQYALLLDTLNMVIAY